MLKKIILSNSNFITKHLIQIFTQSIYSHRIKDLTFCHPPLKDFSQNAVYFFGKNISIVKRLTECYLA